MPRKRIDLTGKKYGLLTVIEFDHSDKNRMSYWKCRCECGSLSVHRTNTLNSGEAKSCGCAVIARLKNIAKEKRISEANQRFKQKFFSLEG